MELYHLHLLGNHDNLYKPNKEFVVDKEKFNNRLYDRVYNMTTNVESSRYNAIVTYLNNILQEYGIGQFGDSINLGEIIEFIIKAGCSTEELHKVLFDAKEMLLSIGINNRELAMEEYRKDNCIELPSRLHSLFACSEEGVRFWTSQIRDNSIDILRIDAMDDVFVSNSNLLPDESLVYGDKIIASYKYFHPKKKDLKPNTNEYLIQGKVRVLEKVDEILRD